MIKADMTGGMLFKSEILVVDQDDVPLDLSDHGIKFVLKDPCGCEIQSWDQDSPEVTVTLGAASLEIPGSVTDTYTFNIAYLDGLLMPPDGVAGLRGDKILIALAQGSAKIAEGAPCQ